MVCSQRLAENPRSFQRFQHRPWLQLQSGRRTRVNHCRQSLEFKWAVSLYPLPPSVVLYIALGLAHTKLGVAGTAGKKTWSAWVKLHGELTYLSMTTAGVWDAMARNGGQSQ